MKKLQHPQIIPYTLDVIPTIDEKDIKKYLGKIRINKIKIAFFGSDSFVIPILQALEQNFEVVLVITAPDSAIQMEAKKLGIPNLTPDKLDKNSLGVLSSPPPSWDLIVVASYGKIIPKPILNIPKYGSLNLHPSLLPKYRGPSPVPATILGGDKSTGVTIIKMDEKMDHGPIVATEKISLSGQEIFPDLINKLFQLGADLLVRIIPDYVAGKINVRVQSVAAATYCPLLTKESGYFSITNPPSSEKLDRMIRAYYPWPGVWTRWNGKIVKFLPSPRHSERSEESNYFLQMEGKKPISWKDFLNGYPDFPFKKM